MYNFRFIKFSLKITFWKIFKLFTPCSNYTFDHNNIPNTEKKNNQIKFQKLFLHLSNSHIDHDHNLSFIIIIIHFINRQHKSPMNLRAKWWVWVVIWTCVCVCFEEKLFHALVHFYSRWMRVLIKDHPCIHTKKMYFNMNVSSLINFGWENSFAGTYSNTSMNIIKVMFLFLWKKKIFGMLWKHVRWRLFLCASCIFTYIN